MPLPDNRFPQNYADWKDCIVNHCRISLTAKFAEARLLELRNSGNPHTRQFLEKYGSDHHQRIIHFFEQSLNHE